MSAGSAPCAAGRSIAFESATDVASVALLDGDRLIGERRVDALQRHAATLLVSLDELLAEADEKLEDYERIALSVGPGSFTGLRIGLALALGLCFGTERRIVPVSTLAALALGAGDAPRSVPMLDARRGQIYTGLYAPGGAELAADRVCEPAVWLEELSAGSGPLAFLGSGVEPHAAAIRGALGERARLLGPGPGRPSAANVGRLGARLAACGGALAPEQVEIRYLRAPEAERLRVAGQPGPESIS